MTTEYRRCRTIRHPTGRLSNCGRPFAFETVDDLNRFLEILDESRTMTEAIRVYGVSTPSVIDYRRLNSNFDLACGRIMQAKPCVPGYTRRLRYYHEDNYSPY